MRSSASHLAVSKPAAALRTGVHRQGAATDQAASPRISHDSSQTQAGRLSEKQTLTARAKDEVVGTATDFFVRKMMGTLPSGEKESYLSEFRALARRLVDVTASTLHSAVAPSAVFDDHCKIFTAKWARSGAKPIKSHRLWEFLMQNICSKLYSLPHAEEVIAQARLIEKVTAQVRLRAYGAVQQDPQADPDQPDPELEPSTINTLAVESRKLRNVSIKGKDHRLLLRTSPLDSAAGPGSSPQGSVGLPTSGPGQRVSLDRLSRLYRRQSQRSRIHFAVTGTTD